MQHSESKRHKHGQLPGDLPKCAKIAMREKKPEEFLHVNEDANKTFRRVLKEKSVTKQRQRDKKWVAGFAEGIEYDPDKPLLKEGLWEISR